MDYVIGVIVALLGAVFFYKRKSDKAEGDAIIGRTQGREDILKKQQEESHKMVEAIDENIQKAKDELAKRRDEKLSEQERADRWNK